MLKKISIVFLSLLVLGCTTRYSGTEVKVNSQVITPTSVFFDCTLDKLHISYAVEGVPTTQIIELSSIVGLQVQTK